MSERTHREVLAGISEIVSEKLDKDIELQDFIAFKPAESDLGVKQTLEVNPADGSTALLKIENPDFEIRNFLDVHNLLKGIHAAAQYATEEAGFTVYPVLEL